MIEIKMNGDNLTTLILDNAKRKVESLTHHPREQALKLW